MGDVSLLPGARLEWIVPAGDVVVRTFWPWPRGEGNATRVQFSVGPGQVTRFDCARLREAGPLFVDP